MRYELTLRVDAPGDDAQFTSEVSARLRERIYGALKLKAFSAGWVRLRPGTPKWAYPPPGPMYSAEELADMRIRP